MDKYRCLKMLPVYHIFVFLSIFNIVLHKQCQVNSITKLKTCIETPSCTVNIVIISSDYNSNQKQMGMFNGKFFKGFNKHSFSEMTSASNVTGLVQPSLTVHYFSCFTVPWRNHRQTLPNIRKFMIINENTDKEFTKSVLHMNSRSRLMPIKILVSK